MIFLTLNLVLKCYPRCGIPLFSSCRKLLDERKNLSVKKRSGYFSYQTDPNGVLGAMNRCLISGSYGKRNADDTGIEAYQQLFTCCAEVGK